MHHILHPVPSARLSSAPPARTCTCALLEPSRSPCTRFRSMLATPGASGDECWLYQYVLIESVSAVPSSSLTAAPSWHPVRESDEENQVPPPQAPPPFALVAAQPTPPAPPHVCRVQPKHPCIASRTHPARAVPVPRPEHARTHLVPIRRPVALTWPVHTLQVRAGDSWGARRPALARSLRARRRRLNGAMYEFDCCRVP